LLCKILLKRFDISISLTNQIFDFVNSVQTYRTINPNYQLVLLVLVVTMRTCFSKRVETNLACKKTTFSMPVDTDLYAVDRFPAGDASVVRRLAKQCPVAPLGVVVGECGARPCCRMKCRIEGRYLNRNHICALGMCVRV
jgi:hypothetical protein